MLAGYLAGRFDGAPTSVTAGAPTSVTASVTPATVLVAGLDRVGEHDDVLRNAEGSGVAVLFVGLWRGLVYVGPYWLPGTAGCPHCLVSRTANSAFGPDLTAAGVVVTSVPDGSAGVLGPGTFALVGEYVAATLERGPGHPEVIVVDGATGTSEVQPLLPDSTCGRCGPAETDSLPVFTPPQVPLTKLAGDVLRTGDVDPERLAGNHLFPGIGLFKEVRQDLQSPFGACSVELPSRWGRREPAIGRAQTYLAARTVAILEGLERYAGLHRGGRRTVVRAAYADIANRAIFPPLLGTHPAESYRLPGFRYRPFDPATVVDWVWAYSFQQQDRVLVPERAAFWGPARHEEVSFFHDTSNGCAVGSCTEEAILHGLREVAERDSYLLTWYRKLSLPEVELAGFDRELDHLLRKSRLFTGFGFRCFLSTMEHGLPSFWLVAENLAGGDGPAVLTGAAAHPVPAQAVRGGLHELVGIIQATAHDFAGRRDGALAMLDDPGLVRRMTDHSLLGALRQARPRYAFLLDAAHPRMPLAGVPATVRADEPDLRADLDHAVDGFLGAGFDVLVVDQTMPELRRSGLHCVRVLVPGLVPMTFGHHNRRTENLPRLDGGTQLPYPGGLLPGEEVGCVPHPFP
jgi:ribosomal protein S12 methylthiotransferase accessory factor